MNHLGKPFSKNETQYQQFFKDDHDRSAILEQYNNSFCLLQSSKQMKRITNFNCEIASSHM